MRIASKCDGDHIRPVCSGRPSADPAFPMQKRQPGNEQPIISQPRFPGSPDQIAEPGGLKARVVLSWLPGRREPKGARVMKMKFNEGVQHTRETVEISPTYDEGIQTARPELDA